MPNHFIAAAAALALAACAGSETKANETEAAAAQPEAEGEAQTVETTIDFREKQAERAAKNLAASQEFLAENAKQDGVVVTESGLQYLVLKQGPDDGATPVSTDLVAVQYVGKLKDGVVFDSSRARGAAAQFRLNKVIPGWTEGVQLMSEGDEYRFFIPPDLAYGRQGRPGSVIGPNQALIFDVELIKVHDPARNLAVSNKFLEENAKKEGVKTTASGLQYEVISEGPADGASPSADDIVTVEYRGALINGTEVDSNRKFRGPVDIPVTTDFTGWTEGVQLMREGDKYRFFIPPQLAYGEKGIEGGSVGPNEALIFEIELVGVKRPGGAEDSGEQDP